MRSGGKYVGLTVAASMLPTIAHAFSVGDRWDWQLSEPLDLNRDVEVLDLHPDLVSKTQMASLNRRGIKTICYVSVGTVERSSHDKNAFPAQVVGKAYEDWPKEKFLDVRQLDILVPLMRARFERCKALGFDAIEPDNMDVHDNDSGFDIDADDTLAYVRALARTAHELEMKIGQKNVADLTSELVSYLDFVITESCFQNDWCQDVAAYPQAGKPVFDAEYSDRPIDFDKACKTVKTLNISMILKDRDLHAPVRGC